ncbi:MAG: tRNA (N6-isopentenyl adenosine(37)-C2)-methylthiotransferase MiaB [Oscillospiraceae bacterium]|nr:tRNA (N6-isopentenyl adenosine(37)-C2)-methylthiotransferase MiaB [Oscillospiraceae bacterium]
MSDINVKIDLLRDELYGRFGKEPKLFIRTYGCQQNVADSERIRGLLKACGFVDASSEEDADMIIFNTCAVRGHAEDRVIGNLGNLKSLKKQREKTIIAVGGCMVHQEKVAKDLFDRYRYVDIIFNTNNIETIPNIILQFIQQGRRVFKPICSEYSLNEDSPVSRDNATCRAFLPIMYGCDNFCSYCIVPYVRGRERSRRPDSIISEFKSCVDDSFKDIMLLGQNVNSYGKGLDCKTDFPTLLRSLNDIDGDFWIRFMSSNPNDASMKLFDTIAECDKVARHMHLAVQSGSNRILKEMNRHYTVEEYLDILDYARSLVPDLYFTSDIIVGFPGETEEDFEATVELIRKARFYSIFSFIYSKRPGTRAAEMFDDTPHKLKAERLNYLNEIQRQITESIELQLIGSRQKALCLGQLPDGNYEYRLSNNAEVTVDMPGIRNEFYTIEITDYRNRRLFGKEIKNV